MKLKTKITIAGWMLNATLVAGIIYVGAHPHVFNENPHGDINSDRINLDQLFSKEYEARLPDLRNNVTPLSVADLDMGE